MPGPYHFLTKKRSLLSQAEIYLTLQEDPPRAHYSIVLSHLPPLGTLLQKLPGERFREKFLVLYFGVHSTLTYDQLAQAGVAFESIPFGNQTLCALQLTEEQQRTLISHLSGECRDWWAATVTNRPTAESLRDLGLVAGPAVFSRRHPEFSEGIVINYFMDPSFHGFYRKDAELLVDELFRRGFADLYDEIDLQKKGLAQADFGRFLPEPATAGEAEDTLPGTRTHRTSMHRFILRGGKKPRIIWTNWTLNRRYQLTWLRSEWRTVELSEPGRFQAVLEISRNYLTPILLVPIAIIVMPVTLVLWPLIAGIRWYLLHRERQEKGN